MVVCQLFQGQKATRPQIDREERKQTEKLDWEIVGKRHRGGSAEWQGARGGCLDLNEINLFCVYYSGGNVKSHTKCPLKRQI